MRISKKSKTEIKEWLKAFVFAALVWILFCSGLAVSTKVHTWHLMQKKSCTVVAATAQDNK